MAAAHDVSTTLINGAADDVLHFLDITDGPKLDLVNLIVNVAIERLGDPTVDVAGAIRRSYDEDPDTIAAWCD